MVNISTILKLLKEVTADCLFTFHEPRQALPRILLDPCYRGFLFPEGVSEYLQNFLQKLKIHNINCFK